MRKKILSVLLAATMVFGMTSAVMAAPSSETKGTISKVESATDADGKTITTEVKEISAANLSTEQVAKVDELKTKDGLKKVVEALATAGTLPAELKTALDNGKLVLADVKDISVPEGTKFPAKITIAVAGVTSATKGSLLHLNGTEWEAIATTFGDGTATGTFNSLSPVAVVLDNTTTTAAATTSTSTTTTASPKTGENTTWATIAAFVCVAALGGAVVLKRKRA